MTRIFKKTIIVAIVVLFAAFFAFRTGEDRAFMTAEGKELVHEQEVEHWYPTGITLEEDESWESPRIQEYNKKEMAYCNKEDENGISNAEHMRRNFEAAHKQQVDRE